MSTPTAILAIGDTIFRNRIRSTLTDLRWKVLEANGGVDALAQLELGTVSTVVMDHWFPDLEIGEFVREVTSSFPEVDLISTDGSFEKQTKLRNNRHGELLYALRVNQELDGPTLPKLALTRDNRGHKASSHGSEILKTRDNTKLCEANLSTQQQIQNSIPSSRTNASHSTPEIVNAAQVAQRLTFPEFIGNHPMILEMCRRIRLVSERGTPVLIQGPSGSGKELVARALHRLSLRKDKPFVAVNCAAIPEALLESELFGHTKGSFTGALHQRIGRVEAASGGTLFLDEIGEMSLSLQAKLLRFLESGEIQRIGQNETIRIDARIIAASNQRLGNLSSRNAFRADLFFRLAVFLIETPSLANHISDLPALADSFLSKLRKEHSSITLSASASESLATTLGLEMCENWLMSSKEHSSCPKVEMK